MSRHFSRRELLLAGAAAAALGSSSLRAVQAANRPSPVTIANASGALNLTMAALMRQERFLESLGLAPRVLQVADGTRILGALVGGSADVSTMSGFGQVFPAIAHGAGLKIIGGGALRPMLALFSGKPAVKTLADLEGRTVGTGSVGALVYQLTLLLLRKFGVNADRVRFVSIGSDAEIFRAVSAGTVDAGAGQAALIPDAAEYGVHLLEHGNMSRELEEYTYQGAWAPERAIARERETLVRVLAAYAKLYRFVQTPQARDAFLRARRSVFPDAPARDNEAQWRYIEAYKPFAVNLTLSPERLRYMQEVNIGFGVQRRVLPFSRVADMSLADEALKLIAA